MTISARSYGSVAGVEALVRVYTSSGTFTTTTIPTLAQVESLIDQISGLVNISLSAQGFTVPVTQADAKLGIDSLVNQLVSDLAHAANTSGRFFTERSLQGGLSIMAQIRKDIDDWVSMSASGLAAIGADRNADSALTVGYQSSNDVDYLFTRDQYGSDTP